jgi:undecaprenyl-diphosphatase
VTFLESLILGIIQGLCEFFPVSSSAHLKIIKLVFKSEIANDKYLFDLICHLGTLLASIVFLRKEIKELFFKKWDISFYLLAILPLFPFYFLFKPFTEYLSQGKFLPFFLLLTSIVLFIVSKIQIPNIVDSSHKKKIKDVLLIGLSQAFALIPGISRSANTISFAHFRGWEAKKAIRFSFMLAIPTILGGSFLETLKLFVQKEAIFVLPISCYIIGFLSSFIIGMFAIRYILKLDSLKKFRHFAIYLLIFAIFSFFLINFKG